MIPNIFAKTNPKLLTSKVPTITWIKMPQQALFAFDTNLVLVVEKFLQAKLASISARYVNFISSRFEINEFVSLNSSERGSD